MIKVVIIEDEEIALQNVLNALEKYDGQILVLNTLRSVKKSVEWLKQNRNEADIIFADIKLPDGTSFDIFNQISVSAWIIFTTAYDEYALNAFKLNSLDYLLKPISPENIQSALNKWKNIESQRDHSQLSEYLSSLNLSKKYKERFLVKYLTELRTIETDQVAYLIADGNYINLHDFEGKKYPISYSLDALSDVLDSKRFFRATRNIIVNVKAVEALKPYGKAKLILNLNPPSNEAFIVSAQKSAEFKNWLNDQ